MSAIPLTLRAKILRAAIELADEAPTFTVEALVVRSWKLYPETFALRGFEAEYPDSNRVASKLSGDGGLCAQEWLARVEPRTYSVTASGRREARRLGLVVTPKPALVAPVVEAPRAAKGISDVDVHAVNALARSKAASKFTRGSPLLLADACAFWGAPHGADAFTAQSHVGGLLRRVVESFPATGAGDPRLPSYAVCHRLRSLHLVMVARFAAEVAALAGGG